MEIKEHDLATFKALYEKEYGVTLTIQRAEEIYSKLFQLYKLVYLSPMPMPKPPKPRNASSSENKPIHSPYGPWYNAPATHKINS